MSRRVCLAACTFRRPEGLAALLRSVRELDVPEGVCVRMLIVDNDSEPSARSLVADQAAALPFLLDYIHAPEPGIPQARNAALSGAADVDFLLFVDDDETVTPALLSEHLRVQAMTGANFVQGPCTKTVTDPADSWWLETVFFQDKAFPDGAPRKESWTNNVLIDMAFVIGKELRFDERLQYAGGEDTLFFQDMVRKGGRGAFAAHARVEEVQPTSRLNWKWAISRQFRYGVNRANTRLLRKSYPKAVAYCAIRAGAMQVVGLGHVCSGIVRGRRGLADGLALISRGAGVAAGAVGFRADGYRR